jgi:hypothetical protein
MKESKTRQMPAADAQNSVSNGSDNRSTVLLGRIEDCRIED